MMNTIPTAKQFLKENACANVLGSTDELFDRVSTNDLIEFTKLHVTEALTRAHANSQLPIEDLEFTLDAYPLNNIK